MPSPTTVLRRPLTGLVAAIFLVTGAVLPTGSAPADPPRPERAALAPRPLIYDRDFADPTVVYDGSRWFGAATGWLSRTSAAPTEYGSWERAGALLGAKPAWAAYAGVWAPDIERGPSGWLAYYTMPARGMPHGEDRCIGVATAPDLQTKFTPLGDAPLVCPDYALTLPASDQVTGRAAGLPRRGVIDPSSYVAPDGRRYLMYRTQGTPSTIRMVRLNVAGTRALRRSTELLRDDGVLENPLMVRHGSWHYLITSRGYYGHCRYRTIWRRSHFRHRDWQGTSGHALVNRANSGVCGPGGADYVEATATHANRIFFHGWVCGGTNLPCYQSYSGHADFEDVGKRALYAARLRWTRDGPSISAFVQGPEYVPPPPPPPPPTETPPPTPPPADPVPAPSPPSPPPAVTPG